MSESRAPYYTEEPHWFYGKVYRLNILSVAQRLKNDDEADDVVRGHILTLFHSDPSMPKFTLQRVVQKGNVLLGSVVESGQLHYLRRDENTGPHNRAAKGVWVKETLELQAGAMVFVASAHITCIDGVTCSDAKTTSSAHLITWQPAVCRSKRVLPSIPSPSTARKRAARSLDNSWKTTTTSPRSCQHETDEADHLAQQIIDHIRKSAGITDDGTCDSTKLRLACNDAFDVTFHAQIKNLNVRGFDQLKRTLSSETQQLPPQVCVSYLRNMAINRQIAV